ncbi:amidohydrolase 2 [Desulforamulus reducens MI-1]|uniref:Amidohydrolase 2 n=1 Tax=Desulforamulus reducens (strain ATCC BAA-1160 / DSM 100696 / MI-1) TaxID=349161 RepID=A4J235_DESRM|nr:amidohydrolase family protein [Desulforamulus reducens]ABO49138.1 amidohydrolase 2 [Desulforamulus reducens MI-1]
MYKIIDGHIHLYPEKLTRAILGWFEKNEGWEMPYKWSADKHIEHLHGIGVTEFIVLAYAHKAGISKELNEWLAALVHQYPEIKPYACVHQEDMNKRDMLKEFLDKENFYGVKIQCFVQRVSAADERFKEVLELLAEREKGLVLHASSMPASSPYVTPEDVAFLLREYPSVRIMVAHLGLPEYHTEYLRLLDKFENLYLDTAYIFGNQRHDLLFGHNSNNKSNLLRETLNNYSDRIVYGSDFPVMDYPPEKAIEHIRSLGLGEVKEEKIFYANAKKFMAI